MSENYSERTFKRGQYTWSSNAVLGKGATGTVYRGFSNANEPVAIKAVALNTLVDEATKSLFENEKRALRMVTSTHIVKLLDIITDNNFCYIVTEECPRGTLRDYIKQKGILAEEEALNILRQILIGCTALTEKCIIHRDLKPENIMLRANGEAVIIDLGYCQIITAKKVMKAFNVGSPSYMAPEAYLRTMYSEKSDSWALAATLHQMVTGNTPDKGIPIRDYFQAVKGGVAPKTANMCSTVQQILLKGLVYVPEQRISISQMKFLIDVHIMNQRKGRKVENNNIHPNSNHNTNNNTNNNNKNSNNPNLNSPNSNNININPNLNSPIINNSNSNNPNSNNNGNKNCSNNKNRNNQVTLQRASSSKIIFQVSQQKRGSMSSIDDGKLSARNVKVSNTSITQMRGCFYQATQASSFLKRRNELPRQVYYEGIEEQLTVSNPNERFFQNQNISKERMLRSSFGNSPSFLKMPMPSPAMELKPKFPPWKLGPNQGPYQRFPMQPIMSQELPQAIHKLRKAMTAIDVVPSHTSHSPSPKGTYKFIGITNE